MPGNGKPPDWIPPGQRPDPEDEWEVDADGMLQDILGLFDPSEGAPLAVMRQGTITKNTFGFYTLVWGSPGLGQTVLPTVTPLVTLTPTSQDGSVMQVTIQYSTDPSFVTAVSTINLTGRTSGALTSTSLGTLTNGSTYYLRARSGDGTNWSEWQAGRSIKVDLAVGNNHFYMDMNIGATLTALRDNHFYLTENVGILDIILRDNHAYIYEGDVNTNVPDPHIWFLQPSSGRSGDGFTIIGHGFGATQGTYTGIVQIDLNDGFGFQTVGVVSWTLVAASAHAYDNLRQIDYPVMDPEHGAIDIIVPSGALPPGLKVRVVTSA